MTTKTHLHSVGGAATRDEIEAYNAFLSSALRRRSMYLEQIDRWDAHFLHARLGKTPAAPRARGGLTRFPPLVFSGPEVVRNEMKLYYAEALFDPRNASYKWWYDRRPLLSFIADVWPEIERRFGARCLADIPSGMRPADRNTFSRHARRHNRDLLELYASWYALKMGRRVTQPRTWVSEDKVVSGEYPDGPIVMIGTLQRWLIIRQEQMAPLERRNIFIVSELFSDRDVRLTERQKRHDAVLNLYKVPAWMRDATRYHLLDKIQHGELGPMTIENRMSIYGLFSGLHARAF